MRLSRHNDPKRKYQYTWELIDMGDSLVGVNTGVPNKLVKLGAQHGVIAELAGYENVRPEIKINAHTRLDLLLTGPDRPDCYVEIKNCTLVENGRAEFPDAITTRGRKHLEELASLVASGNRGVIFFLVQRMDARVFGPADSIDPEYGKTLRRVVKKGVEILAYDVAIGEDRIDLRGPVAIDL